MKNNLQIITIISGTILFFLSGILTVAIADQHGLTASKVDTWLKGYEEAWEKLDPEKAAQLFTENATYRDNPYETPHQGKEGVRKYWATVTADQKDVDFTYEVLSVTNNTGIAYWHSEFTSRSSGAGIILDGIFVLEFNKNGLCESLKEWWHLKVNPTESG